MELNVQQANPKIAEWRDMPLVTVRGMACL